MRLANGIVVITFKQPVDVSVDRIPMQAAGYVNAARTDPDGVAVRLALGRKVTVNTMAAGEKLFVDLLPEGWSGLPPGLAAGRRRGIGAACARGREEGAGAAASRAAARSAAGAGARRRAADFHALHLRPAGADRGLGRAQRRQDDDDVRGAAAFRSRRCAGGAAADGRRGRLAIARRQRVGAVRLRRKGRYPHLPRGQQLRRRCSADSSARRRSGSIRADRRAGGCRGGEARITARPAAGRKGCAASPPTKPASEAISPTAAPAPAEPPQAAEKPGPPATIPVRESEDAKPDTVDLPVVADVRRHGDALRITFPFAQPTPAAVFRRADTIWLVFDNAGADRHRQDRGGVGQRRPQRDGHALARRTGGAAQARSAEAHQCRHRRQRLDRHRRRHDARADAAARHGAPGAGRGPREHRRSRSTIRASFIASPTPKSATRCWSSPRSGRRADF